MTFCRRLFAGLLACAFALQPLRADDLPELGDVAASDLSPAMEKLIGRQVMSEIWRDPAYLDDSDVENYLNVLGGKLAAVSNDPGLGFTFFAINDPNINAFALPGGYVGVHTGLILAAQTESELAGVLAHEISHVTQHHIARQMYQSRQVSMVSLGAMLLAILAARSSSQVAGGAMMATQAGVASAQLAFSRDFEREADRIGFDTLHQAGFDVRGMGAFFGSLQKATRLFENNATAFLRTHPLTGERLTDMQNRENAVDYRQVPDSPEFQLVRAKLRAMQGTPLEATKDFERLLKERKFASEEAMRYGLAEALLRNRDWARAEQEAQKARGGKAGSPMVERLYGEIRLVRGDADGGLDIYRRAIQRSPRHQGLLDGYAKALLATGRFAEALRFAQEQLQWRPESIRYHRVLAASHAGLGHITQQHQALAETFVLQGLTQAAVEQLELAQKAGDADFYVMSAIDARLRELRRQLLEEKKERRNG
ncbi:MAG: M48 family metalloprotease [Azonexus sp.]|jgi:predicted Zn-dependent protease|nr:M48 family metalloprotease [Azonexus sp.]